MKMICPYRDRCKDKLVSIDHHCNGVHEKTKDCGCSCYRDGEDIYCTPVSLSYYMKEVLKKDKE